MDLHGRKNPAAVDGQGKCGKLLSRITINAPLAPEAAPYNFTQVAAPYLASLADVFRATLLPAKAGKNGFELHQGLFAIVELAVVLPCRNHCGFGVGNGHRSYRIMEFHLASVPAGKVLDGRTVWFSLGRDGDAVTSSPKPLTSNVKHRQMAEAEIPNR
jgi:hypothetical protein